MITIHKKNPIMHRLLNNFSMQSSLKIHYKYENGYLLSAVQQVKFLIDVRQSTSAENVNNDSR